MRTPRQFSSCLGLNCIASKQLLPHDIAPRNHARRSLMYNDLIQSCTRACRSRPSRRLGKQESYACRTHSQNCTADVVCSALAVELVFTQESTQGKEVNHSPVPNRSLVFNPNKQPLLSSSESTPSFTQNTEITAQQVPQVPVQQASGLFTECVVIGCAIPTKTCRLVLDCSPLDCRLERGVHALTRRGAH